MKHGELDKIAQAFKLLAFVSLPDGYLREMELVFVNAHLDATKVERARHLLATRGRREAAAMMGCSEAQVYRLANMRVTIPESSAELEAAA